MALLAWTTLLSLVIRIPMGRRLNIPIHWRFSCFCSANVTNNWSLMLLPSIENFRAKIAKVSMVILELRVRTIGVKDEIGTGAGEGEIGKS